MEHVRCLHVQSFVEVKEVSEEAVDAPDDFLETLNGTPAHTVESIEAEDGETNVPFLANVGVPQTGAAHDDWGF